jgi:deferrochelatase/peroxidase EfeB
VTLKAHAGANSLAVLIGNSKNLWDRFQDAYEKEKELQAIEDPLDTYTERCMQSAASSLG